MRLFSQAKRHATGVGRLAFGDKVCKEHLRMHGVCTLLDKLMIENEPLANG